MKRKRIILLMGVLFIPCRHLSVTDPDIAELFQQPAVFDYLEKTLIENQQIITAIPHEFRGQFIKSLSVSSDMIKTNPAVLKPVNVERDCCLLIAKHVHEATSCYVG